MASVNKVILVGNLGADPELRYTQNQTPVGTLSIATSESWTGNDGQKQEKTEWHRVVLWKKTAENAMKYLQKGSSVYVEGKLETRKWTDQAGVERYTTEIKAQTLQYLSRSGAQNNQQAQGGNAQSGQQAQGNHGYSTHEGFPQNSGTNAPPSNLPDSIDDIPF